MKRICHITSMHKRYSTRIFQKQCSSLAKNGYDVFLVVNDEKPDELIDGVHIVSTGFEPRNRKEIFIESKSKLFDKAIQIDAEIYQLHDPDLIPLGMRLKRRGKKVIFDSHEDMPTLILDKKWIPKIFRSIISGVYEIYEKRTLSKFDGLISVTPHIVERLKKINKNTVMITNYPIINKNVLSRNPKKQICFAGGIGPQWCHYEILDAIEGIANIKYILAGRGSRDYIETLKKKPSWSKVEFVGFVNKKEVEKIYSESTIGMSVNYASQIENEGTLGNNKLFEYMSAGMPVICSNYKLWKEIVEDNNCGICVDPKNSAQIKKAITTILNDPNMADTMGINGRKVVEKKYNWSSQEVILTEFYDNIWYGWL
ncbi:MAG: glycosyltransferase family 4 protein [Eubacteriales bacterium]